MKTRKSLLIFLLTICAAAISCLIAISFSGCSSDRENIEGVYVLSTADGEISSKFTVGDKTVTAITKSETATFLYKRSGNVLNLDTGTQIIVAEGGDVIYMPHLMVWANGYTSSLFEPLRQRNGYFTQIFSQEQNGVVISEIVFAEDGTFGMLSYSGNQVTGHSYGTYEFERGLLTINDKSTGHIEQLFFYVDESYNIYRSAGVKETSVLYKPGNSGSDENTPSKPDTPTKQDYTLTYNAGQGGRIIGSLSQTVESGKDGASVIAVADEGYEFIGWSDGVETAERQDKSVTANIAVTAQFEIINNDFVSGAGTKERPYRISNTEQLKNIQKYPNSHFILINDIVFDGTSEKQNFTPLFSDDNMFNGSLDGNGHKISNLTIYNDTTFYTGLFACIGENGCVKNLTLENVNLSGTNYIGGIAGYSLGEIKNCSVSGEIINLSQNNYKVFVGGIVGKIENEIDKCVTDVKIICSGSKNETYVGGIAGYYYISSLYDENPISVSEFYALGDIVCERVNFEDYIIIVGGLFGHARCINFDNVYSAGDITVKDAEQVYVGGLIGRFQGQAETISNSYSTGNINASGTCGAYIGGLVGSGSPSISKCYTTGNVTATFDYYEVYAGGLVGTGGDISNSYATGNVSVSAKRIYLGGLAGSCSNIYNSYATGAVVADSAASQNDWVYVGGLVGVGTNISTSYTIGDMTVTVDGNAPVRIGGLIGSGSYVCTIDSSYTVGKIDVICKGTLYCGALVGLTSSFKFTNAHWMYYNDSGIEYAVGYCSSMGIPSSIGSTKHTEISDFYTLAEVLNKGLDKAVWENIDKTSFPTLKCKDKEN